MVEQLLLIDMGVIVLVTLVMGILANRFRQSSTLGYILAGIILGPLGLKYLVPNEGLAPLFGELGMIMILFYLGLELNMRKFKETGATSAVLAAAQMATDFAGGFIVGKLFGLTDVEAIVLGTMIVSISTVIVARFVIERKIMDRIESRIALSILMLQDFFAIFIIVFLTSLSSQKSFNSIVLSALLFMVGTFFIVSKVSRYVLSFLHTLGHGNKMVFYAIGVGVVVSYAGVLMGLSETLGAYFAGFALAETVYGDRIKKELGFFREFFVLFFFVSFGSMLFYDSTVQAAVIPSASALIPIVAITLTLLAVHLFGALFTLYSTGILMGVEKYAAGTIATLLIPLGEFVILIATASRPLLSTAMFNMISAIAFLLILFSAPLQSPMYDNSRKITDFVFSLMPESLKRSLQKGHHSVLHLEHVAGNPAMKNEYVQAAKRMLTQLVIALSILYLGVFLTEKVRESGVAVPFVPPDLSAGLIVLLLVSWPVYRFMLELRFLVEIATRHLIHSAFPAIKRSALEIENEVAEVFTGVLLSLIGIAATVFAYYAFKESLLYVIAPAAYTILALMNLSKAFYSLIERYESAAELAEADHDVNRQKEIKRMSREFDEQSHRIRALNSERERMRERVKDAIRHNDMALARSLMSQFTKREEKILSGLVNIGEGYSYVRPHNSREAFENYLLRQAADYEPKRKATR